MESKPGPEAFSFPFSLRQVRQEVQHLETLEEMRVFLDRLIDHLIRQEEANERLHQEELSRIQESMDSLHYAISHDLRAPLRSIEGFSRILMEDYGNVLGEEGNFLLQTISGSIGKMNRLISDLLRLSRLGGSQPLRINPLSFEQVLKELWPSLIAGEAEGRKIDLRVQDSLPVLFGDEPMLRQLLESLLSNAIKCTRSCRSAVIEIGGEPGEGVSRFYVRDNGPGFDMKHADKIFTVLSRLVSDSDYEGTGTGLAIAKRVVERHQGRIWAESQPGRGATFYFELPLPS